jgi:hypothetical protein
MAHELLRYWSENVFTYKVNVILDPKNPLIIFWSKQCIVKFDGQGSMGCRVIDRELFLNTRSMWPYLDFLTPKSIGVIHWPRPMHLCSLKAKGPWVVKLLIGNHFDIQGQFDLDLWPKGPKNNKGHLLVMNNPHTKFEVPKPKLLLVIDQKPFGLRTNQPIDRQMQSNIPPFEGGHNYLSF